MTLLNKVKDDVVRKHGYENFNQFLFDNWLHDVEMNQIIDEAMQEYAKMLCEKQKEICAENAEEEIIKFKLLNGVRNATYAVIDKESILNTPLPNELKE